MNILPWPSFIRNGDKVFWQSCSPSASIILSPLMVNIPPGVYLEVKVDWGCSERLSLLPSHVIWYKNRLCFKSLLSVTASDLHGKTKGNRLSTLQICT